MLRVLPKEFPAAVFIALHRSSEPHEPQRLTRVIASESQLPVHTAEDEHPFQPGHAYVAPSDRHLLVENGLIRLLSSPREQRFRPCVDVLFKSAALTYGRRVVGVLLSGTWGEDGTAGLWQINDRGGVSIVQDPVDAEFPVVPQNAVQNVRIDHVLPAGEIGSKLIELVSPEFSNPALGSSPPRVLIVEDESIVADNLRQGLEEMGYDPVGCVGTGESAIEVAERSGPDLILMDIHLKGSLSGIEAARQIWKRSQIPIVYCTALSDLETLKAVQTTECYGYVVKPFHSQSVRAAIELALARREKELRHTSVT